MKHNNRMQNTIPGSLGFTIPNPFHMNSRQASILFWGVAIVYGVLWTVLPWTMEENYRLDVIEMFFIGKEGVVSTFKHPALNSAILEIVYQALGRSSITPYLLSQICFIVSGWCVWRLSREFLQPFWALVSSLCFFGYWGYFYKSLYYNHNVTLFPVWGLITLFAYHALTKARQRDWIFLGLAIGVGVHCKYTVLVLVASILIFMTLNRNTRKHWLTTGPYLTTAISLLVAVPQLVWLFQSDFSCFKFPEINYGIEKTFINRCYSLCNDALLSFPVLVSSFAFLLCPFLGLKWKFRKLKKEQRFARNFLFTMIAAPLALQMLIVFVKAIPMEFGNYMQLYLFLAPLLLLCFKRRRDRVSLRLFAGFFAFVMIGYLAGYSIQNYSAHHWTERIVKHAFPGRKLAEEAEAIWYQHFDRPLPYVVGGWWYAGNVAIYGKDRPSVHTACDSIDLDEEFPLSNWSTDDDVRHFGGLVLWKDGAYDDPESVLKRRFPGIRVLDPIVLTPDSSQTRQKIYVGIGIVPPDPSVPPKRFCPSPWKYYGGEKK